MKRLLIALGIAAVVGIAPPVAADTIVYGFAALPGDVAACRWFDENLNDRSLGALARQVDLLYNRVALPAGTPVTVTQTATTTTGTQLVAFTVDRKTVCIGIDAVHPSPIPSPAAP
ncbi:MAG TPA: hypothetical protein VNG31_10245 [Candidatus Baltobacteraceae bacterium]|nr:hypothetical protein [Candidatus Baltobacteraceae bacterium]